MRRLTGRIAAVLLGMASVTTPGFAQIEAGDKSVGAQGLFASGTGDADFTFGMGYLSYNKFQTKKFAWRLSTLIQVSKSGDETDTQTGFGGGLEWNFNTGQNTIPFVAMDMSMFTGGGQTYTLASPSAGFRAFVSRSTSFDVALSYNTIVAGGEDASGGIILGRLGFSYYLGKDPRR